MDLLVQVLHDLGHHVLAGAGLQETEPAKESQLALDGSQRAAVELALLQQHVQLGGAFLVALALGQELIDPALAQAPPQVVQRTDLHLGQAHQVAEHVDILRLDLVVADAHLEIHFARATSRGLGVEGHYADLAGKELAQALYLVLALRLALPAILVVHVKDQVDCAALLDDARQQGARQKGLAGAAFAKDAAGALHEPAQVQVHAHLFHVQGGADVKVPLVLGAKDLVDVLLGGLVDRRKVGRHRLDRLGLLRVPLQHQHGRDLQAAKGAGPLVH